jgi:hypothetical protein
MQRPDPDIIVSRIEGGYGDWPEWDERESAMAKDLWELCWEVKSLREALGEVLIAWNDYKPSGGRYRRFEDTLDVAALRAIKVWDPWSEENA